MNQNKNIMKGKLNMLPIDRKSDEFEIVDRNHTTSKRHYQAMSITPIAIDMEQNLLAGSVTQDIIDIEEITVRNFEDDTAFPAAGFDVKFN